MNLIVPVNQMHSDNHLNYISELKPELEWMWNTMEDEKNDLKISLELHWSTARVPAWKVINHHTLLKPSSFINPERSLQEHVCKLRFIHVWKSLVFRLHSLHRFLRALPAEQMCIRIHRCFWIIPGNDHGVRPDRLLSRWIAYTSAS